jgi:Tol biopolymer transport system component
MYLQKVSLLCLLLLLFGVVAEAKIVFGSRRDGVQGVYVMDDDGSNQTLLIQDGEKWMPFPKCWSPDGKWIAFERRHSYNLMHPDGTNIQKLMIPKGYVGKMSFSPDGKSIVYDTYVEVDRKEKHSINVLNIESGAIKEIADVSATFCDWSPDGKSIVFSKPGVVGEGGGTLWIMGSDGNNPRKLLPPPVRGHFQAARWSPDGKQIVFIHHEYVWEPRDGFGMALIYKAHRYLICDRLGRNIKQLRIPKNWFPLQIDWMDDGKSVVFSAYVGIPLDEVLPHSDHYPPSNIYKYHIPTTEITQLTDHPGDDNSLDWISDDALTVSSKDKIQTQWGTIKKMLQKRSESFKSLSHSVLYLLRH